MSITKKLIELEEDIGLRDYQNHYKEYIYKDWNAFDKLMLQLPTGTGKTRLFSSIIKDIHKLGVLDKKAYRVLILVHRNELIDQISNTLSLKYNLSHGLIKAGIWYDIEKPTQVASIQTLSRRLEFWKKKKFDFIIIDEAHHSIASSYINICSNFEEAKILGVTATPYRLSGEGFRSLYDKLILSETVNYFINKGVLSKYEYYSIKQESIISNLIRSISNFDQNQDYPESELSILFDQKNIRANLLDTYLKYANGKRGIVYTINIAHNHHVCKMYQEAGISARSIDSGTNKEERQQLISEFRKGKIDVLCNVNIFSEGFDCPELEFIQFARPTKSLALYLQQAGRGLRTSINKTKTIFLDNVGLYHTFGLPSSERNWQIYFDGTKIKNDQPVNSNDNDIVVNFIEDFNEGDEKIELIYSAIEEEYELFDLKFFEVKSKSDRKLIHAFGGPFENDEILSSIDELDEDYYTQITNYKVFFKNGKFGIINITNSEVLLDCLFDEIKHPDINGRSIINFNGKIGLCEIKTGKILVDPVYSSIISLNKYKLFNYYEFSNGDLKGVLKVDSSNSKIILNCRFEDFQYGRMIYAYSNENWEIFSRRFNQLTFKNIKPIKPFNNFTLFEFNSNYGISDINNEIIHPPYFSELRKRYTFLLFKYDVNDCWGVFNNRLDVVLNPEFNNVEMLNEKYIKVKKPSGYGIYKTDGTLIIPCQFENCDIEDETALVFDSNGWNIFSDGNILFSQPKKKGIIENYIDHLRGKATNDSTQKAHQIGNNIITESSFSDNLNHLINEYKKSFNDNDPKEIRLNKIIISEKTSISELIKILELIDFNHSITPNTKISQTAYSFIKSYLKLSE
jgi:superfamily II DNA or RNA helicase